MDGSSRTGRPDHGKEVEPDEKRGYHLKFDARVDGSQPHLVPQEEIAFNDSTRPLLFLVPSNSEVDGVYPLIALY